MWAAEVGDLSLLKRLEAVGVSLNSQDPAVYNWTPLMGAIYFQQTNIISYLLSKDTNLDLQDARGQTALMWAITTEDTDTVRRLLEKGANTSIKDRDGINAYGYAEATTSPDRPKLLRWLESRPK